MKIVNIVAYEMDDGKNFVGRPFRVDMESQTCRLRDGCIIRKESFPAGKNYEQTIIELYPRAAKSDVVQFGLAKVVKKHEIGLPVSG